MRCRKLAVTPASLLKDALECQEHLDLHGALVALERARRLDPDAATLAQILALASKQWTDHTYLLTMSKDDIKRCNAKAVALARRAQAADPTFSLAHAAECISKGRLAEHDGGPKAKLKLGKEAQEAAYRALACDSDDDIAHHLIGRWNKMMADLPFVIKQCIKHVFGTELRPGTVANARAAYETAQRLRPDRPIHKIELARCHAAVGEKDAAIALIQVRASCVNMRLVWLFTQL